MNAVFLKINIIQQWELCKDVIIARGPDSLDSIKKGLTERWHGHFCASVLWMQGLRTVSQPLVDTDCNILLWNGDVFAGDMVCFTRFTD